MKYDINRPWLTLDKWQKEYIYTDAEINCFLLTSRQAGKTTAMSIKAVELCIKHHKKGEDVLIVSVTEKQGYHLLAKALSYAHEVYPQHVVTKGKDKPTKHRVTFRNGTHILCYAAGDTGEGLRGFTIKKLMIDEGSRMSEEFFVAVSPMLSVIKGSMDIASTPCGARGFFYKRSEDPKFKKFYAPAEECPRHTEEFLADERKRMTKLHYAQEYEAQFLDALMQFFPDKLIKSVQTAQREKTLPLQTTRKYYIGVDVGGMGGDESTFEVLDVTDRKNIKHVESETMDLVLTTDTTRRILALDRCYLFKRIYVDDGGLGFGVFSELIENPKTRRRTVAINNSSRIKDKDKKEKKLIKEELYNNLKILMERGEIELLDDPEIFQSLRSVQFEYTDAGKFKIFGKYTHIAEGLVRAAWAVKDKSLNISNYCKFYGRYGDIRNNS